ncbi:heterokaryon incompatibility protein-domain-containing protein, partial [Lasiosphaeria hispida]
IRLLRVTRGKRGDPIHAVLQACRLWDRPRFKAVSYTWATATGDTARRSHIFLGPYWFLLPVTVNCPDALECFRKEDEDITLWVDAICIDQNDNNERNHQVGMMDSIYAVAQEVLVYIGAGDSTTDTAL